jgi:hypothetical protein
LVGIKKSEQSKQEALSFAAGARPVVLIGLRAPQQVFFDLVEYHLFHRLGRKYDPMEFVRIVQTGLSPFKDCP